MELLRNLDQLNKGDVAIAGGKGASLGEMTQAGISVPPGFVILATTFEKFLEEADLSVEIDSILHSVDINKMHTIEDASEKIHSLLVNAKMPKNIEDTVQKFFRELDTQYVAVRSSATAEDSARAAWAGQLESYLNTTEEALLENVKKCWASLFTPRAIFYRFEKELHKQKISVAVVVQKMVESEKSGIAFSVHPVTQDENQLIIEAGWGLGEAIVPGQITPDSYVVEKQPRRIIDKNVQAQTKGLYRAENGGNEWRDISKEQGENQVLSENEIFKLSNILIQIENHYGFPCDIEWTLEHGNFSIVQSRPITTLRTNKLVSEAKDYDPSDYVRMFAGKSFTYILSAIFLNYYKVLGVLTIQDKETWMSFLPKTSQEKTSQAGKELYTSKENYREYRENFYEYMESSARFFQSVLKKDVIVADEVEKFFELASKHFSFYSKTEFFHTDLLSPETMVLSIHEFDTLKLDGRSYLGKIIFEEKGYVRSLVNKLSVQTGVPESELLNYGIDEVVDLIKNNARINNDQLKKRHTFFASEKLTLFKDEAKQLVEEFLSTYRDISDTITGTIASEGKARGKARVFIPDFRDFDKMAAAVEEMERGEILVAETTSPEIIQACKKAAAIITNQGGMLSHAAIVSRELGIPCIVGTDKDVTLNIKTGDELEVDANKGIIRILKK